MKLLALDTSTDTMSIAVQYGDAVFAHTSAGGTLAFSTMNFNFQQRIRHNTK